jgi:hydroxymethylpyrimidine pyrophosphatase-like HAD family hydrolase
MQNNDVEIKNTQTPLTTEKLVDIAKDKAETIFNKEFGGASISTKISLPEEVTKPYLNALLNLKEYSTYFRENKQNTANALRFLNAYKQSVKELRAAVEQLNKKEVEEAIAIDWTGWEDPTEFIVMGNTVEIVSACVLKHTTISIVLKHAIERVENGVINIDKLYQ